MKFYIITLFPEVFKPILSASILKRAQDAQIVSFSYINPRDFSQDQRKTVDDKPYGGGAGMVMMVEPLVKALESIKSKPHSILLSASGKKYSQKLAKDLSKKEEIALICGHYEGVDARLEKFVDEIISIGDFVLTGGEIAALSVIDSITRLLPGVIRPESLQSESFSNTENLKLEIGNLKLNDAYLEYPQFTRPEEFRGLKVPKVLLSGNHKEIENWRRKESLKRLKKFRPDLSRKI